MPNYCPKSHVRLIHKYMKCIKCNTKCFSRYFSVITFYAIAFHPSALVIAFHVSHIKFSILSPFSRSKNFLKTGIANPLDGSGDDKVWDDSSVEENDEVEEILPPSWDADGDVPEEDWDRLFKDSDSSDDFDGFRFLLCDCNE